MVIEGETSSHCSINLSFAFLGGALNVEYKVDITLGWNGQLQHISSKHIKFFFFFVP